MSKYVIITGANGFVGRNLVKNFVENNYGVVAVVRSQKGVDTINQILSETERKHVDFVLSTLESIDYSLFPKYEYVMWLHAGWGGVSREGINDDATQRVNYLAELECVKIAEKLGCICFCDTGSRAEYANTKELLVETISDDSLSRYGYYKQLAYIDANAYCQEHNLKYLHFRLFSVIGEGDHPWSVVMSACKNFSTNAPMSFGACTQMWNFMDVRDVVDRIRLIFEKVISSPSCNIDNGIFNVASSCNRTLKDYIMEIYDICDSHSELTFGETEGFHSNASTDKMNTLLGAKNEISFRDSIISIIETLQLDE